MVLFKQLLSLFLELPCSLCDRNTPDIICPYCQKKLQSHQLDHPDRWWRGNLPVFAWGKYDGQLKQAIANLKYHNQPEIGIILGSYLGKVWLNSSVVKHQAKITVVPIPLYREKFKVRGFNQAEVIAKGFCQETGYLLNRKGLIRRRDTKAMFGLNPSERSKNLQDAFTVGQNIPRFPVLLLDDIYTAGTTVKEAAKVFRKKNVNVLGAVVTAKAGNSQ